MISIFSKAFRRSVAAVIFCAAAALPASCARSQADPGPTQATPPSVIIIVIDTLRADYLGAYGFDGPISPRLDELARESVLFERCSSQAPWTTPSVSSMLTSLYPEAHGVHLGPDDPRTLDGWRKKWTRAIPEPTTTLAECLHDRGYRTAAFVANPWMVMGLGFEQGFDIFDESSAERGFRDASRLLNSGLLWLRSKAPSGDPTLLYVHLMDVHGPYTAPEGDFAAVRESAGFGPPRTLPPNGLKHMEKYLLGPKWTRKQDRRQLRTWRGRYAAGVHATDRRLGFFIQALKDEGLWEDQIVIVTSDHGEELFDHGGWDHGFNLHEHQLHVPLMIRLPGSRLGGLRITEPVRLVDLMPTVTGLAGASSPPGMVGLDLLPLTAKSDDPHPQRPAFSTSAKHRPGAAAIFDGRHKLISDLTGRQTLLFDLVSDPTERTDLAGDEPEIVARLSALLAEEISRVTSGGPTGGQVGEIPKAQLEQLRKLGYLD